MFILDYFDHCNTYGELVECVKALSSEFLIDAMYVAEDFIGGPDEFNTWEQDIFEACWDELNSRGISNNELKESGITFWFYEESM